jgi:RHS repeat-associated protein
MWSHADGRVVFGGVVAAVGVLVAGALAAGGTAAQVDTSRGAVADVSPLADNPVIRQELADAMERAERRKADLDTPEARAERERSRTEFVDLDDAAAVDLAGEVFPGALRSDVWAGARLGGGRVERYLGDFGARIEGPGGVALVVQSTVPLRALNASGEKQPVALALADRGGFFESRNPLVPVRFSKDADEGVTLLGPGVGVRLEGAATGALGRADSDRLVVPGVLVDTDLWAMPVPAGFESFVLLRSAASPDELTFDVSLPEGAELRALPDGGAEVVRKDSRLVAIGVPAARDADGTPVPVEMTVDGARLVLRVPHSTGDVRYPLLVDPVFEDWDWVDGGNLDEAGWYRETSNPGVFDSAFLDLPGRWGKALYIFTHTGAVAPPGSWSQWSFDPQGTAYAYQAELIASANGSGSCVNEGIFNGSGWDAGQFSWCNTALSGSYLMMCTALPCNPAVGTAGNKVYQSLASTANWTRTEANKAISGLSAASVAMSDRDNPDFGAVNRGSPAWATHYSGTISGPVRDFGLGMETISVSSAANPNWGGTAAYADCDGIPSDPCPQNLDTNIPVDSDDFGLSGLEGKIPIELTGKDVLGHQASITWGEARIDRSAPTIDQTTGLSGDLWTGRVINSQTPAISPGLHTLQISATDGIQGGTALQRRSGVKSIEVRVDGEVALAADSVACPTDSCPRSRDFVLNTADFAAGQRTVKVVVKDQVGNETSRSFDVKLPPSGTLLRPVDGQHSSKLVPLQARADAAGLTSARFQYRRPLGVWADIPVKDLADQQGQPVSDAQRPFNGNTTEIVNWDVPATFALGQRDGPLQIRAVLSGGIGGVTNRAGITVDERGLAGDNASESVGPGTVDLLTGNFVFSADDVSIASFSQSLTVSRSFNSRDPSKLGPLGPGWVFSVPIEEAGADYKSVKEMSDGLGNDWVELVTSQGSSIFFFPDDDGGYEPETGYEDLLLTKPSASRFQLKDTNGNTILFDKQTGVQNEYSPTEVSQPASATTSSISYGVTGGSPRVLRMLAPVPGAVTCSNPNTKGCRSLEFKYADMAGAAPAASGSAEAQWGSYGTQLDRVEFTAWDPATGAMKTDVVARYLYDNNGKLRTAWDPRISPALKERYDYDTDGRLKTIASPGNTLDPADEGTWTLSYQQQFGDGDGGRLKSASQPTPQGLATTQVVYGVPLSGVGAAPYQMGASDVAAWAQADVPASATAVFSPSPVPIGTPPTLGDYGRATIHYMNAAGWETNVVVPGGHTSTSEHDRFGNVTRELTAANRQRAMDHGCADPLGACISADEARALDTQRTYSADGLEMVEELGPRHDLKLDTGSTVAARARTTVAYDEGAPAGISPKPHLPTTTTVQAELADGSSADARVTKTEYDWTLRKPTRTIVDPNGLNIRRTTVYNPGSGLPTASYMPKSADPQTDDAGATKTIYYALSSSELACSGHAEWTNLPCMTKPAQQPGTAGLPDLTSTTVTYNRLNQVNTVVDSSAGNKRVTTSVYDNAGRIQSEGVTANGPGAGLVAAYGFEEGSGTAVADRSGNGNNGAISGATWSTAGKFGKALSFDGVNDTVTVPDANSLDLTSGMTIEAWVKPTTSGGWRTAVMKERTGGLSYALYSSSSTGLLPPVGKIFNGAERQTTGTIPIGTGTWTHLAVTYDGSQLRFYNSGLLVGSTATTGPITTSTGALRIGGNSVLGQYFAGLIDEVRIHNRALTLDEIQTYAQVPVGASPPPPLGEPLPTTSYSYDPTTGRQTSMSAGGQTITTGYDSLGRVVSYTDADGKTSTTTYDLLGRPTTVQLDVPSGGGAAARGTTTYTYDQTTGLLTNVQDTTPGGGTLNFGATYDPNGQITSKTYPNGMTADTTYDPSGAPTDLTYTKTTNCASNCVWFEDHISESIHGQWRSQQSSFSNQTYAYDTAGRLTQVTDRPTGQGCTTRTYAYDKNSNRLNRTTRAPGAGGACDTTSAGQVQSSSYDLADRLTSSGVVYDSFGRMTTVPASHSGGGTLQTSYYVNDMVRSQTQNGVTKGWLLDPSATRQRASIPNGTAQEILHYADDSDSPAWTVQMNGASEQYWNRNIEGIDGDLAAIYDSQTSTTTLQLANLHGDIVATASTNPSATSLLATVEGDEFGNPKQTGGQRYGWLGAKKRSTEFPSGVIQMGVRSYVPALGRFTSTDPISGGSANSYDYGYQDPLNELDLDGKCAFDADLRPKIITTRKYVYWELCKKKTGKRAGYLRFKNTLRAKKQHQGLFGRVLKVTGGGLVIAGGVTFGVFCSAATDAVGTLHCARAGAFIASPGVLLLAEGLRD